ncbi:MAG: hypothetical protein GY809_03390, partial [Planctomycetes bacterium]|nr:hypothetical protein [Planctomycetota bacterium]
IHWQGEAEFASPSTGLGAGGCVRISSAEGTDAAWFMQLKVRPFSRYKLTCRIKTENVTPSTGQGALINLHGSDFRSEVLTGTNDWKLVTIEFPTYAQGSVQLNCLFGGWGKATGTAWYDQIQLEHLESQVIEPKVVINPVHEETPISEYVYGQFIEHLGHCIYGGIWSEMLYDRKFYYPITEDYAPWGKRDVKSDVVYRELQASPWRVMEPSNTVTMIKTHAYAGEHSPQIGCRPNQTSGIVQETLGLVAGRRYIGRIVLAGQDDVAVTVSLVWGSGANQRQSVTLDAVSLGYEKYPLAFTAQDSTETGRLEITATGKGHVQIGAVSLMPADNIKGWRRDVVQLMRELNAPVYRWPGGNFVSGYDWKDGIGDPDKRLTRKNPAWKGLEYNDVGLHEFMDLCSLLETEPFIAVNTGLGKVASAAEQVQYCNGSIDTPMGKWRADNGSCTSFNVKWWAVGNEMYGGWQLGHMPLADYVKKHNRIAEALWAEDSTIQLVGVGATGKWS